MSSAAASPSPPPPQASLTQKALGGIVWTLLTMGSQSVIRIVVVSIQARLLTPADFGLFSAAMIVVGLADVIPEAGLEHALMQRREVGAPQIRTALVITTAVGGVACGVTVLAAEPLLALLGVEAGRGTLALQLLASIFVMKGLQVTPRALLNRDFRLRRFAVVNVVASLVGYAGVSLTLGALGFGYWALVLAQIGLTAVETAGYFVLEPRARTVGFSRSAFRELTAYGLGDMAHRITAYFALKGDNAVVSRAFGEAALGVYGRAYQLVVLPGSIFANTVGRAVFPAVARVQHDPARLATALRRAVAVTALVGFPCAAGLWVLAPEVVAVILGPQWDAAITPVRVLALGMHGLIAYRIGGIVNRARGNVWLLTGLHVVYAAAVVAGAYAGSRFGLVGVASGVVAAILLHVTLSLGAAGRVAGLPAAGLLAAHRPGLALGLVALPVAAGLAAAGRAVDAPSLLVLAGTLVGTVAAVLGALRAAPTVLLGADGGWFVDAVLRGLPGRLRPVAARLLPKPSGPPDSG